jgi:peptidoglycan DL-endopeptidase CwlO
MVRSRTAMWTGATVLLCLALVALTWLLMITPRRDRITDLSAQETNALSQNDQLTIQIKQLRAQATTLATAKKELASIQTAMPTQAALPTLVRKLNSLASQVGLTLTSITPGTAALATASAGTGATSGTGGGSSPATLIQIPITVTFTGDFYETSAYVKKIQTAMPRSMLVTDLNLTTSAATSTATTTATSTATTTTSSTSTTTSGTTTEGNLDVTLTGRVFCLVLSSSDSSTRSTATSRAGAAVATSGTSSTSASS